MLLHTPDTTRLSFADSLKRSAKKFFLNALDAGWAVTTESINGGSDRIRIRATDLVTALTWASDGYSAVGPLVEIEATFAYDTGGFDVAVYHHVTQRQVKDANGHPTMWRYVDTRWNDDKIADVLNRLNYGPVQRRAEEERNRQRKAENEAKTLRHEALVASRRAAGDSEVDKVVRELLENLVRNGKEKLDLSQTTPRLYSDAVEKFHITNELAAIAKKALKTEFEIVGEYPNEVCLSIAEAAAHVAEDFVAELVHYGDDSAKDKARRKFVEMYHPIYGDRFGHRGVADVRIVR